ncbi:unnamed protein product [Closterium sp. NIES-54]
MALSVTHSVTTASSVTHSKTTDCRPIGRHSSPVVLAPAVNNSGSNAQPTVHSLYSSTSFLCNSSAEQHSDTRLLLLQSQPCHFRTLQRRQRVDIALQITGAPNRFGVPTCFRTDEGDPDILVPHHPDISIPSHGTSSNPASSFLDTRYGPWANAMMERQTMKSLQERIFKEQAGGGGSDSGGRGGDDDDGKGGDGGGDGGDDGDEGNRRSANQIDALPFLSLAFAALHACYCIVIGLKEKVLPPDFLRTAAGLSSLLIASALRLNSTRYGFDSYVLGLGASVGVSVWSVFPSVSLPPCLLASERFLLRKEPSPSSVAAVCSVHCSHPHTAPTLTAPTGSKPPMDDNPLSYPLLSLPPSLLAAERCFLRKEPSPSGVAAFDQFAAPILIPLPPALPALSLQPAERYFLRKEPSPSGVAALCSAIMAALYTCAFVALPCSYSHCLPPRTSRPAAARASRPAALRVAPYCSQRVAPYCSQPVAPYCSQRIALCCPARRALLQPACRALLPCASRPAALRVVPCCSQRIAPCCPARRALLQPARRALLQPARRALLPLTRAALPLSPAPPSRPAAAAHATAATAGGAAGSAAGAGGAGGATGSAGGAASARAVAAARGGQRRSLPLPDDPTPQKLRGWVLQRARPGGGGFGFLRTAQRRQQSQQETFSPQVLSELFPQRCVTGSVEAAALGASESASALGASDSAAALGASESAVALGARASPATGPSLAEALHTFTLDSVASRCFFRDCTTLTPLAAPVPVSLADPTGGPVVARASTVLPCPAVPSGSLSGLHLPTFSTNLVSNAAIQDV